MASVPDCQHSVLKLRQTNFLIKIILTMLQQDATSLPVRRSSRSDEAAMQSLQRIWRCSAR